MADEFVIRYFLWNLKFQRFGWLDYHEIFKIQTI